MAEDPRYLRNESRTVHRLHRRNKRMLRWSLAPWLFGVAACSTPANPTNLPLPPAAIAMGETVDNLALAYPDAVVTDVMENSGRVVACGLLRFENHRPHLIYAISGDGKWVVSVPYLALPNSWDDERNRTLSETKKRLCARFGVVVPLAD